MIIATLIFLGTANAQVDPDNALWNAISTSNSENDLQVYLKQFTNGKHAVEARERIATLRAATDQADMAAWQKSQAAQSAESLQAYLREFPNGIYSALAKSRLTHQFATPANALADQATVTKPEAASTVPLPAPPLTSGADTPVPQALAAAPAVANQPASVPAPRQALAPAQEDLRAGTSFRDCPVCPQMVWLPTGSFIMGSSDGAPNENPPHTVNIAYPLAVATTEITRAQFAAFAKDTQIDTDGKCERKTTDIFDALRGQGNAIGQNWREPGFKQGDTEPAVCVNWDVAVEYARWLSERTGMTYRLLSEAEWEYAARAGSRTRWFWGDTLDRQCDFANGADLSLKKADNWKRDSVVTPCTDGYVSLAPVASFQPNAFGLYDMIGNAWEWIQDCQHENYIGAPDNGEAWNGTPYCQRMLRGGDFASKGNELRPSQRKAEWYGYAANFVGLRVARSAATPAQLATAPLREQQWRWQRAAHAGQAEVVKQFLADYPDSEMAEAARQKLAQLNAIPTLRDRLSDGSEGPVMVIVPPGELRWGTPPNEVTQIHFSKAFAISKYELSVGEYMRCVRAGACSRPRWQLGANNDDDQKVLNKYLSKGASLNGNQYPITGISWNQAHEYVAWLNANKQDRAGEYRLPSTTEWTYAAWAGSESTWPHGNDVNQLSRYAWFGATAHTREVGTLAPNAFGLHDMLGNVAEWVEDCPHKSTVGRPVDGSAWVTDCSSIGRRVYRGGETQTVKSDWPYLRTGTWYADAQWHDPSIGVRLARSLP